MIVDRYDPIHLFELVKRSVYGVCFCKRANARSISSRSRGPLRVCSIHCLESICEVADDITQRMLHSHPCVELLLRTIRL
jgi:hypothetical protein